MIREEQIRSAAYEASMTEETIVREEVVKDGVQVGYKDIKLRDSDRAIARLFFREGVEWADRNPKSPWISVEERLPTKGKLVIVKTGIGNCYLAAKDSVALPKDEFMLPQLCSYVDGVTHWMPIPELPKGE
jgi:hypothetical protein